MSQAELTCNLCGETKPIQEFRADKGRPCGFRERCKKCAAEVARAKYANNPEKFRASAKSYRGRNTEKVRKDSRVWAQKNPTKRRVYAKRYKLKKQYGMTREEVDRVVALQHGKCAIDGCDGPAENIDHDHKTGTVRAILCGKCNRAIGLIMDDKKRAMGIYKYLEFYEARTAEGEAHAV